MPPAAIGANAHGEGLICPPAAVPRASPEREIIAAASLIQLTITCAAFRRWRARSPRFRKAADALVDPQGHQGPGKSDIRRRRLHARSPCSKSSVRGAKLVVTSSPYPGLHTLYHGWQVAGRKEAPLPFIIANKLDAHWIGTIAPYT